MAESSPVRFTRGSSVASRIITSGIYSSVRSTRGSSAASRIITSGIYERKFCSEDLAECEVRCARMLAAGAICRVRLGDREFRVS